MTITLTTEMAEAVKSAVSEGQYASSSEIIREALRDWQHKRELQHQKLKSLQVDVQKGEKDIQAGRVKDFDPERIIEQGEKQLSKLDPSA